MTARETLNPAVAVGVFVAVIGLITGGDGPARAQIAIKSPTTTGEIDIGKHNEDQFKAGFTFAIRPDLSQLDGDRLLEEVRRFNLKTRTGEELRSFTIDKTKGLIVASTHPGSLQITLIRKGTRGTELIVSARDKDGRAIILQPDQIGVFDLKGTHVGFNFQRFVEAKDQRAHFMVLIDRSGSMASVMKTVSQSAIDFMKALPANSHCRVLSFNHELTQHGRGFQPCKEAASQLGTLRASGGTNLYGALLSAFAELAAFTDQLKAVVLISDGVGDGGHTKSQVLRAKNAPLHVYFLGSHREAQLTGIADTFIYGESDIKKLLGRYFDEMARSIENLGVITLHDR